MSRGLRVVPASAEWAERLAPLMRQEDRDEVWAAAHWLPLEALLESLAVSCQAWCLVRGEEPLCMWGVSPLRADELLQPGQPAVIWLLTGRGVDTCRGPFLAICYGELKRLLERHPLLVNHIDARYTRAVRWARRLGATLGEPVPFGMEGLPFHPVTWRAETWAPQSCR